MILLKLACIIAGTNAVLSACSYRWLQSQHLEKMLIEFENYESERRNENFKGLDRRNSTPFITGDGFRSMAQPYICDESNNCKFNAKEMTPGACVFVKADNFKFFATVIAQQIEVPYILISHNGDLSTPDGQSDAPSIGMPWYNTSTKVLLMPLLCFN